MKGNKIINMIRICEFSRTGAAAEGGEGREDLNSAIDACAKGENSLPQDVDSQA